jgi:hypothetical protein
MILTLVFYLHSVKEIPIPKQNLYLDLVLYLPEGRSRFSPIFRVK